MPQGGRAAQGRENLSSEKSSLGRKPFFLFKILQEVLAYEPFMSLDSKTTFLKSSVVRSVVITQVQLYFLFQICCWVFVFVLWHLQSNTATEIDALMNQNSEKQSVSLGNWSGHYRSSKEVEVGCQDSQRLGRPRLLPTPSELCGARGCGTDHGTKQE